MKRRTRDMQHLLSPEDDQQKMDGRSYAYVSYYPFSIRCGQSTKQIILACDFTPLIL
jgi:hypothetical protein